MHHGMPECHKPFLGHCDLDLWPSFKYYCVQSIFPILFDVRMLNLGWWFLFGWRSGANHFESLWPWHWLLASFLGFSCYITDDFPQMCLMLDQFLWGHSSRVCDISCFSCFFVVCWYFSNLFFSKNSFRNTIRVSNSLVPDQAGQNVGLDLGLNCLQRLSADDISSQRVKPKNYVIPFIFTPKCSMRYFQIVSTTCAFMKK